MERNPYRQRIGGGARLRLEALEDRALLAVAAFEMNLYRDVDGAPEAAINGGALEVGESFFVEITAQEFDPRLAGLRGVALDIAWDPAVLEEIDDPFDPAQLITPALPAFQSGTLDQQSGTIDNLAGGAFLASDSGQAIGGAGAERFALLHFRAVAAATDSALVMSEGRSSIVSLPTATFVAEQLDFERQAITVRGTKHPLVLVGTFAAEGPAATPEVQVNLLQDPGDGVPTPTSVAAVDPAQAFAVEILVETPSEAEPVTAASAPTLDVAALPPFAETVDVAAGQIWVTRHQVRLGDVTVDLPIAVGPIEDLVLPLGGTRRIGLMYVPEAQMAATDAALAAASSDAWLSPSAGVQIDHALMQALACGLASSQRNNIAVEPLFASPV